MAPARTVVVAGAGFSGVVVAAHLLRRGGGGPPRVVLVNRSGTMARGVAYGTNSPAHVLNVAAGRSGASPDDPDGFLRFARGRDPGVTAGNFVPRRLYGDYLAGGRPSIKSAASLTNPAAPLHPDPSCWCIISQSFVRILRASARSPSWYFVIARNARRAASEVSSFPPDSSPARASALSASG
jgi:hypothetical protein